MGDGPPRTVRGAMLHHPRVHDASTTVARAREYFDDGHVHALLVVDGGVLRAVVERVDLVGARADALALDAGRLDGRVVVPDAELDPVWSAMMAAGLRRLAVVDDAGVLRGLLCLKRSGRGFCTDAGVAARSAERRRT